MSCHPQRLTLQSPHFGNSNTLTSSMQLFPLHLNSSRRPQQMIQIVSSSFRGKMGHSDFWKKLLPEKNIWEKYFTMYLNLNNKTSYTFSPSFPISKNNSTFKCDSTTQGILELILHYQELTEKLDCVEKLESSGLQVGSVSFGPWFH